MRTFENLNPIAAAVYFAAVIGAVMFGMDPVMSALSLVGAVAMFAAVSQGRSRPWFHLTLAGVFLAGTALNPLLNHRGTTVLFVLNNNPVTLEALFHGAANALMIVSVMYWFGGMSRIMTSDKLLYIFGSALPKLSLILSMALRYIPMFARQTRAVNSAQKAMGLYRDDGFVDGVRSRIRVFSVMVMWALENGITTADSMEARGYGAARRSFFSIYRFTARDALVTALSLVLAALALLGQALCEPVISIYPWLSALPAAQWPPLIAVSYAAYAVLAALPVTIWIGDELRWRYLQSKI